MSDEQNQTSQTSQACLPAIESSVEPAVVPSVVPAAELKSPVRLRKPERSQVKMRICCDDDLIPAGHQARVIWAVVSEMDLSAFHEPIQAREGVCGRDATAPVLLIALWLYASTRGVGSARELARLCGEDGSKPYQWLCGGVSVNHHTLSDFRTDHADALDELFTQVLALLAEKGLVKVSRISQDGTRVRACAGTGSFRGEERLNKLLASAVSSAERKRPRPTWRSFGRCWRTRRSRHR